MISGKGLCFLPLPSQISNRDIDICGNLRIEERFIFFFFSCLESTVLEFLSPPLCGDSRVETISVESIHRGSQHEELRGPKTTLSGFLPSRLRELANLQWSTVVTNDAFDGNKRKSVTRVCKQCEFSSLERAFGTYRGSSLDREPSMDKCLIVMPWDQVIPCLRNLGDTKWGRKMVMGKSYIDF